MEINCYSIANIKTGQNQIRTNEIAQHYRSQEINKILLELGYKIGNQSIKAILLVMTCKHETNMSIDRVNYLSVNFFSKTVFWTTRSDRRIKTIDD